MKSEEAEKRMRDRAEGVSENENVIIGMRSGEKECRRGMREFG